jgi:hypothetical protein
MAEAFKRNSVTAQTSQTAVLSTVAANTQVVIIGLLASNKDIDLHEITVEIHDGANTYSYITGAPLPVNSSLALIENKIVLMAGDSLLVTADANNAVDVTASYLEMS